MNAIETRYKGYRFRSRLEARWAVFFDTLGVPWEYESQGFSTSKGPYLPDFLLWGSLWAEVKPDFGPSEYDERRIRAFAKEQRVDVALLFGAPDVAWFAVESYKAPIDDTVFEYIDFAVSARDRAPHYGTNEDNPDMEHDTPPMTTLGYRGEIDLSPFIDAVNRARGARFEHGERP